MTSILPVVEMFHSLQGEGAHVGRSAFFIRLAGCNVECPWCDTKDSWSTLKHPQKTIDFVSKKVVNARVKGASFVVITGGEPLHHNLNLLCSEIRKKTEVHASQSIPIHLETSGVNPLSGNPTWITLSPKPHAPPLKEALDACHEIKIVINQKTDLTFAEEILKSINHIKEPLLFLQPGWNNQKGKELVLEYVKHNPKWRLSLQIHKWIGVS